MCFQLDWRIGYGTHDSWTLLLLRPLTFPHENEQSKKKKLRKSNIPVNCYENMPVHFKCTFVLAVIVFTLLIADCIWFNYVICIHIFVRFSLVFFSSRISKANYNSIMPYPIVGFKQSFSSPTPRRTMKTNKIVFHSVARNNGLKASRFNFVNFTLHNFSSQFFFLPFFTFRFPVIFIFISPMKSQFQK